MEPLNAWESSSEESVGLAGGQPAGLSPLAAAFACESSDSDGAPPPPSPPRRPRTATRPASPPPLPVPSDGDSAEEPHLTAQQPRSPQAPPQRAGDHPPDREDEPADASRSVDSAPAEFASPELSTGRPRPRPYTIPSHSAPAILLDSEFFDELHAEGKRLDAESHLPVQDHSTDACIRGDRDDTQVSCGGADSEGDEETLSSTRGSWYSARPLRYSAPSGGSRYVSLDGGALSSDEGDDDDDEEIVYDGASSLRMGTQRGPSGDNAHSESAGRPPIPARGHSRANSSSAVLSSVTLSSATSRLKKGWKAVKKSGVKSTASAGRQLSSLSSSYWKSASLSGTSSRAGLPMTPAERAAWEERQSGLCDEWVNSILPSWRRKRSTARTRDLAFRGIPPGVRGRVWRVALGNPLNITPDLFDVLKDRAHDGRMEFLRSRETVDKADGDVGGHGGRAEPIMLAQERSAHKAIMLDLPRTFPELAFFHADGSQYEDALREVLEAFMYLRPDIGYSQGMSFLAAVLLLYMDDSAVAFTCFANMLLHKSCFLHFFRMKMPEVRIYLSMHDRFVREEMPSLHAHFKQHGVDPDLYMINWVMSLYCGALPLDLVSRIWDIYVLDGDVAIFRAALGILKLIMSRLMSMGFEDMAYLLSHIPRDIEADTLMLSIRGVRAVTKQKFKDGFRSCRMRLIAEEERQAEKCDAGANSGGGSGENSPAVSRASSGVGSDTTKSQIGAFDLRIESHGD